MLGILGFKQEPNEVKIDRALRPKRFDDYIGQKDLVCKLRIAIEAANQRKEPVDHILIFGPPGLGKTTIAHVVSHECDAQFKHINAPSIRTQADLIDILTKMKNRGVLFIDEIHAVDKKIEEILYSAMEDFVINIKLGNKEIANIPVRPFCLMGATTNPGKISAPLRDRFGIIYTMDFYSDKDIANIVTINAIRLDLKIMEESAINNVAKRSRGTPRIANRLLRRVRDYAQLNADMEMSDECVDAALTIEGIDEDGLTSIDKRYIMVLYKTYNCGPVGVHAMAATIGEDRLTLEEFIEPFLVRKGMLARTKQGRLLTAKGMEYVYKLIGDNNA